MQSKESAKAPEQTTPPATSNNPLAHFWDDPQFVSRLMGSYGFNSDIEPKFESPEEQTFYKELAAILRDDPQKAAQQLEARIKPESSAILSFTLATIRFQLDQNADAIKHYEAAIAKFPDFRRAHKNLGFALVKTERYEEAIPSLTKTIELGGADANTFGLLGFCFLNLGKNISAEAAYRNAMLYAPENADWKLGYIKSQIARGKYQEAADMLDELLEKNFGNEHLWTLQAGVFLQMEQPKKAAVNYEVLRKLNKATAQNLMLLGDIYMAQDAKELALPVYLEGVEQDGGQNVSRTLRATEILVSRGAWDEAREMFTKIRAVAGEPLSGDDEFKLLKLESKVAIATGEGDGAIQVLEKLLEKNPMDGEALLLAGDFYSRNGDRERAAFRFELASQVSGFEADGLVKHAQLLVRSQKYPQAIELLRKAQKVKPRDNVQRYLEAVERIAQRAS